MSITLIEQRAYEFLAYMKDDISFEDGQRPSVYTLDDNYDDYVLRSVDDDPYVAMPKAAELSKVCTTVHLAMSGKMVALDEDGEATDDVVRVFLVLTIRDGEFHTAVVREDDELNPVMIEGMGKGMFPASLALALEKDVRPYVDESEL